MGTTIELRCARELLPQVVRRWLSTLSAADTETALGGPETAPSAEVESANPEFVGAVILGRIIAAGHAPHTPEGFQARALRIAAAVEAAPARFEALARRPPGTRQKLQSRLLADLMRRVLALLEEAELYRPPRWLRSPGYVEGS